ncbi:OmpA family protein [Desulfobacter sp.]|uniref:OmpA family protein n=1 Tax=Desulfobacter sp. TaxID=2294 RepID=UPI003D0B4CB7
MQSKIIVSALIAAVCLVWSGICLAFVPEGELHILVPGRDGKISFQSIDETKVLVSVLDSQDKPVKDLMAKDFEVTKGGIPANVLSAEILKTRLDVPISYVLMVDNSFSMEERKAVQPLLAALDEFLKIVRPIDEVDVVVFDRKGDFPVEGHHLRLATLRSNNVPELKKFFEKSFKEGMTGETYLYEGILGGLDLISRKPEKTNKFLVVFSDGEDLNSNIKKETLGPKSKGLKNFKAFSIDFMPGETKDQFLDAFSQNLDGKSWKAKSADNLLPIFRNISTTLLYQYVVEYNFNRPPQASLAVSPASVSIEDLTIIDSSPLLNYIFFDLGQSSVPDRYRRLKTQGEAGQFDEKMLEDTMAKYYHVLNIIGKRLTVNPGATIELVGCISDRGPEKNNLTLSRARAESVKSYFQYIWNIDPSRMTITARKLPEKASTGNVEEARVENQRVEIRSDSPDILDAIKSTYTFQIANTNEITVQPNIKPGYDLKNWKIEIKGNQDFLNLKEGQGNTVPNYPFDLAGFGFGKISAFENISVTAFLTDITGQTFETDPAVIPVRYTRRVKAKSQRNEQRVMEKYALILFDYDSAEIKERNKVVLDRVVKRIRELPDARVTILGQTDIIGTEDYNLGLSQRRAKSVFQSVTEKAIPSSERIEFKGNGPHDPPYDNTLPEGRSFNRTVIITLTYQTAEQE